MSEGTHKISGAPPSSGTGRSVFWFVVLVWPVVVALVALRWSGALHLSDELAQRPRVVVMDVQGTIQAEVTRLGGDDAALKVAIGHVQDVARDLRSQGYVVLDQSYVYAYPQSIEVRTEEEGAPASPAGTGGQK
ncbi:hypothetical protein RKE25_22940 (plasmid) [Dyella sp. BiH032]|uniref:hypothetical protein n=1 Tax=Dyella sp. BiH032 TaxID=3075430 RepID=UPI002892C9B7|nr:hypothetical protein [Dyella sp. BiH032]WNL48393.1 hypothetical protein RKE25_22940 [Dyella sp. BiH032]